MESVISLRELNSRGGIMAYQNIVYTKENHVATARFNRPEVLNALDVETHIELHEAIRDAQQDSDVRVMVITGTGRAFAAGRDLRERAKRMKGEAPPPDPTRPSSSPWDIGLTIWNMPKPVIAAVNGIVVGGGLSIVLACDIILASENASFGELFVRTGRVASGFTNFLLPRMIGPHRAKQMLFTGDLVPAKEAERIGLVNAAYPAAAFTPKVKEFAER